MTTGIAATPTSELTPEKLSELEAAHKRIATVRGRGNTWTVVLRKPSRAEYKQFRSRLNDDRMKADAQEALVRSLCVYPSREAFDVLLEEWPAIPEAASEAVLHLMGMVTEADLKA